MGRSRLLGAYGAVEISVNELPHLKTFYYVHHPHEKGCYGRSTI